MCVCVCGGCALREYVHVCMEVHEYVRVCMEVREYVRVCMEVGRGYRVSSGTPYCIPWKLDLIICSLPFLI